MTGASDNHLEQAGESHGGVGATRRAMLGGAVALIGALFARGSDAQSPAVAQAAAILPRGYGAVGTIAPRVCNLGIKEVYGLGVELDRGVLDVAATAAPLGLSAPTDMDDLLQNSCGAELHTVIDAVTARPAVASFVSSDKVYGTADLMIPPATIAFMAERAGSKADVVDGASHVVMVLHPGRVAAVIEAAAGAR